MSHRSDLGSWAAARRLGVSRGELDKAAEIARAAQANGMNAKDALQAGKRHIRAVDNKRKQGNK